MATVQKIINTEASAEAVWEKIANVGSISDIVGFIAESRVDGDTRVCTMADGGVLEERIVSIDDSLRRVAYCITNSPLGFEYHSASMQVLPNDEGSSLVWTTDIKPDALADQLSQVFAEAVPGMQAALQRD